MCVQLLASENTKFERHHGSWTGLWRYKDWTWVLSSFNPIQTVGGTFEDLQNFEVE